MKERCEEFGEKSWKGNQKLSCEEEHSGREYSACKEEAKEGFCS